MAKNTSLKIFFHIKKVISFKRIKTCVVNIYSISYKSKQLSSALLMILTCYTLNDLKFVIVSKVVGDNSAPRPSARTPTDRTYNAKTLVEAKTKTIADKQNPRKGCNGWPFSRMKRVD